MGTATVTAQMVTVNPTNATIKFELTTVGAYVTLVWGNTTSYGFTALAANEPLDTWTSVFLNFLEPNTTYYYKVTASTGCYNTGTATGSFSTGSDLSFISGSIATYGYPYIFGTIHNTTGAHAGAGIVVMATCVQPYILRNGNPWYSYGTTDSSGQYWIYVPGYFDQWTNTYIDVCQSDHAPGSGSAAGYLVCLANLGVSNDSYCGASPGNPVPAGSMWVGQWNETVVTWAPQVVNFNVPHNYISPYFPAVLDFSNAAAGYSTIGYSTGTSTSYTTSFGFSWSIGSSGGVGLSGSSSTSTTYTEQASGGFQQNGGNLDYIAQMETTGAVEFNAVFRAWAMTQVTLFGSLLNGEPAAQNPNFVQPADWLTPMKMNQSSNTPNPYFVWNSGASEYMEDVLDSTPGFYFTGGVTTSTTVSATSGYAVSFGVTSSLPGVGSVSLSASAQWSQTSSTTFTQELTYSVGMPATGGSPVCIDVVAQGGSGTHADMFGIYTWSPNSQGKCTTP